MSISEDIRHFRMINSEEVIGEIIGETNETFIIMNPYMVIELPTSVSLAKYVPFSAEQSIELKKVHIITATELHEEMIRYYKNTITLGRNTAEKAMQGLAHVNDMMEDYIYEGTVPSSLTMEMVDFSTHEISNTVH